MKKYEYTAHTADVGLRAFGRTEAETFENAALGMFNLLCDVSAVEPRKTLEIALETADEEENLLADWLNELLFLYESRDMLFSRFRILELSGGKLRAEVSGEPLDRTRHELGEEIKAATYHMLRVRRSDDGWTAQVIFDI